MRALQVFIATTFAMVGLANKAGAAEGWYAGAALGTPSWGDYASGSFGAYLYDKQEDDLGGKAILGFRARDWLAIEANYTDLGTLEGGLAVVCIPEDPFCGGRISQDGRTLSLSAIGSVRAGRINLFARAGLAHWELDYRLSNNQVFARGSDSGSTLVAGLGAELRLRVLSLRLEFERQELGRSDADLLSIGATWSFGR